MTAVGRYACNESRVGLLGLRLRIVVTRAMLFVTLIMASAIAAGGGKWR